MSTVIPDISPMDLLARFRGTVTAAAPGYPEVIHLDVRDGDGDEWTFSTFYARYSPEDPDALTGKVISDAALDQSGELAIGFSDGSGFVVTPIPLEPDEAGDDLETWHLITPDGLSLWYGPLGRWHLGLATDVH
jgi:hypothetical protein